MSCKIITIENKNDIELINYNNHFIEFNENDFNEEHDDHEDGFIEIFDQLYYITIYRNDNVIGKCSFKLYITPNHSFNVKYNNYSIGNDVLFVNKNEPKNEKKNMTYDYQKCMNVFINVEKYNIGDIIRFEYNDNNEFLKTEIYENVLQLHNRIDKLSNDISSIKDMIQKIYFSPGMPGYYDALDSFNNSNGSTDLDIFADHSAALASNL